MLALLANHNTQLVLANRCEVTNKHFSDAFGTHREQFIGVNETTPPEPADFMSLVFGADNYNFSINEQLVPRITPDQFMSLRRGGKPHKYLVDMFLTQGGRTFENGCPCKLVTFSSEVIQ